MKKLNCFHQAKNETWKSSSVKRWLEISLKIRSEKNGFFKISKISVLSKCFIDKGFGDIHILAQGSFFSGFSKGLNRGIYLASPKIG